MRPPETLRVLIADDELPARQRLAVVLREQPDLALIAQVASGPEALTAITSLQPDLAFLDVRMPGFSGVEALRRVSPSARPIVIFTTAFDQYALDAFEHNAIDYLLKPFTDERLRDALDRATAFARGRRMAALEHRLRALLSEWPAEASSPARDGADSRSGDRLTIRQPGRVHVVNIADIQWIAADHDHVVIHLEKAEPVRTRGTLAAFLERMAAHAFLQVHRSAAVNPSRVVSVSTDPPPVLVVLQSGARLPVSRRFRRQVMATLTGPESPALTAPEP